MRNMVLDAKPSRRRRCSPRLTRPLVECLEARNFLTLTPQLVADINPTGSGLSNESAFVQVGEATYFRANNGFSGNELWKTDGKSAGTVLVKDIRTGVADSTPRYLTAVGGTLFFTANDGLSGQELWKSDGTAAGTILVKDIRTDFGRDGPLGSFPNELVNINGTLFFVAENNLDGRELWKSDGTPEGTVLVKNISGGGGSSRPDYLTNVNGKLLFTARAEITVGGSELWMSDGSAEGTVQVKEIVPGLGSGPRFLTNLNGTLLFQTNDREHGFELWKSNGTSEGTVLIKDIYPGAFYSEPFYLTPVEGRLFFRANDASHGEELWASDGTADGTVLVKDIHSGSPGSSPQALINVNGTLFFQADDGVHGHVLWKSDGTAAGTLPVKEIELGKDSASGARLANVNGTLYFSANDGVSGFELWRSDGTAGGTFQLPQISPGLPSSYPQSYTSALERVLFTADDGTHGRELWTLKDINAAPIFLKGPDQLITANDGLQSVFPWATAISAGPSDEADQTLSFGVTNDTPELFAVQPVIDLNGRLTFVPARGASGTAAVTVVLRDNGGTADGGMDTSPAQLFRISITPAPTTGVRLVDGVLNIIGSSQRDAIHLTTAGKKLLVSGTFGQTRIRRAFSLILIQKIKAALGDGNDLFTVYGSVHKPVFVNAGFGNDRIFAGGGPSLFVGGDGTDLLIGGRRRDVLIGGAGQDQLIGGGGSDLLIAGTTSFEQSEVALSSLQQEWNSSRSQPQRIANLRAATGPVLQTLGLALSHGKTVFDDNHVDTLFGGAEDDWYFLDSSKDKLRDKHRGEIVR